MKEPVYDEDIVNLGYLKKTMEEVNEKTIPDNISRNYATQPSPPYYVGDTWISGNTIYTCINTRTIGSYTESDWVTESGAKEEAESKNKVYLTQPTNYKVGDMWILQSDNDHRSGKKGEILISTVGRKEYDADDWVNMLGYGTIRSINEVANNISDALKRLEATKTEGVVTVFYSNEIPGTAVLGNLWYVTDNTDEYIKGNVYKYNDSTWEEVNDTLSIVAFEEANEARLVADGKIQSFYSTTEPTEDIGVGDIWKNTTTNKLYRYNGTNWVAVYDTNLSEIRENLESVTTVTTELSTDLGNITATVSETETRLNNDYLTAEQIEAENNTIKEGLEVIKKQQASMELTSTGLQVQIDSINENGVATVKNTLVEINENGVEVSKGEEFKSLLDDTGVHLTAYDKVIAEYTKDGASMYNLTVQNEAIIGNLRCLSVEVEGEKRTHIHWIGG